MSLSLADLGQVRSQFSNPIQAEVQRRRSTQDVVQEAMQPWSGFDYSAGDPSYYGLGAGDWVESEREMMQTLAGRAQGLDHINPNARFIQDIVGEASAEFGVSKKEALDNLYAAFRGGGEADSFSVRMGLPSAHADERLGLGAMELSGFDDVRALNDQMAQATDLQGNYNGQTFNIDSQKHLSRSPLVQLGALQNVEGNELRQMLRGMPQDTTVLSALHQLQQFSRQASGEGLMVNGRQGRMNVSGAEDKILQSSNSAFNPNPGQNYQQNEGLLRKDGLMWSDRGGYNPEFQEFYGRGPFDPERPRGLYLADLEGVRGELAETTLGDFQGDISIKPADRKRRGLIGQARDRGNQLSDVKLLLPKSYLRSRRRGVLPRLAGEALQAFTSR